MHTCPYCQASERQVKTGRNRGGSQRYQCQQCQHSYKPQPTTNGYDQALGQQAVRLYLEGHNLRRIGRILQVSRNLSVLRVKLKLTAAKRAALLPLNYQYAVASLIYATLGNASAIRSGTNISIP